MGKEGLAREAEAASGTKGMEYPWQETEQDSRMGKSWCKMRLVSDVYDLSVRY